MGMVDEVGAAEQDERRGRGGSRDGAGRGGWDMPWKLSETKLKRFHLVSREPQKKDAKFQRTHPKVFNIPNKKNF